MAGKACIFVEIQSLSLWLRPLSARLQPENGSEITQIVSMTVDSRSQMKE
jgi:hypothetical protein